MIKFVIRVPGEAEQVVSIDGNEAIIGKAPSCNLQLKNSPLVGKYVSREHVKVQFGVMLTDLKSVNGVWVGGQRIDGSALLQGRIFQLGANPASSPQVEILEAPGVGGSANSAAGGREIERLQRRIGELEAEVRALRAAGPGETASDEQSWPAKASPMPAVRPGSSRAAVRDSDADGDSEEGGDDDDNLAGLSESIPSFGEVFGPAAGTPPRKNVEPPPPPRTAATKPARGAEPAPAAPSAPPGRRRDLQHVSALLDRLVREDVSEEPLYDAPVEEFFTLESLRVLRQMEKVVTRLARDFVQLYDMKTELPGQQGNFRSLAAEVLVDPDDRDARRSLVQYLQELRRWLGVALSANRKAAQQLAREIKQDLSIDNLTAGRPVPPWLKYLGQEGAELWRRSRRQLQELTDEAVEDRIDRYAKEYAKEVMDRERTGALYS